MFPELFTKRLKLEQILPADQEFIFRGLSHPQVIPFYGVRYDSFEATTAQMDWYQAMWQEGTGIPWKIVETKTGESIGVISVYFYKPQHNKAEVGFWLLPGSWNKGFATEALETVVQYWQQEKKLHRLEAFVQKENEPSCRLLEKMGFSREGLMKDCEMKEGKYISLYIYALVS